MRRDLVIRLLQHCNGEFTSITPLVGSALSKSSLYRHKDELLRQHLLETNGRNRFRTTGQGLLQLQSLSGKAPKGLLSFYPPLAQVPTTQHRAMIELTIAAVIARRNNLRIDRHPTMLLAGPTLTWKTSTGQFLCHMLGLDPGKQIVNLAAESGRSLWLRKTPTGGIAYKRELLDTLLVVFDEYQKSDAQCRRLLGIWMDGRKRIALENEELTIEPVPVVTLNPSKGKSLEERLLIDRPLIRRTIPCDLTGIGLPDLTVNGEDIINAAKTQGVLELPIPRHDCTDQRTELANLFRRTLTQEGQGLVDIETLLMLSCAMTAFLEPTEAVRLVSYNSLLLYETLGWTKPGWILHVNEYPETASQPIEKTLNEGIDDITPETWVKAFGHLESGGSVTELVTELHLSFRETEYLANKFFELKGLEGRTTSHSEARRKVDTDLLKLQHDVNMAELRRKKAELERPLDIDQRFDTLISIFDEIGAYKRNNCGLFVDGYCLGWYWSQKPNVLYWKGEPLSKENKWYINPTFTRCSICHVYLKKGEQTLQDVKSVLHQEILELPDKIVSTLDPLLNSKLDMSELSDAYNCSICGAERNFAFKIECLRCHHENLLWVRPDRK